jgi:hypothetical protein
MWSDEVSTIDGRVGDRPPEDLKDGVRQARRARVPARVARLHADALRLRQVCLPAAAAGATLQTAGWKFLITAFEEYVKPRTEEEIARADAEIRKCAVCLRRKRNTLMDIERMFSRIEFAAKAHGVRVVAIDPFNEIDHHVPRNETKTD